MERASGPRSAKVAERSKKMSDAENINQGANRHYERENLVEYFRAALDKSGLGATRLTSKDLAPLDQFHSRGLAATVELAKALPIDATTQVVDIGSGLGGPSRYLAEAYGCTVHGIDLSESFVDLANYLAEHTGLQDKVTYRQGNALDLPFSSNAFDVAWTQHVAMNIADRDRLYGEAFRVLRHGGHFAIFDVVAVSGDPLHYPVPWARGPETSFLVTAERMQAVLAAQGFRIVSWTDCTEAGIAWFREQQAERAQSSTPPLLALGVVMGPEFGQATVNLHRNLSEGRVALIQAICEKV
jgi:ubiquinone/menaquinone biosynthesis C-methylase UbiE